MVTTNMFEILHYDFFLRALEAGVVVAIAAPLIGMFLVVRRFSYLADTLAHVSLVGVAAGALFNVNPVLAALVMTVLAAFGVEQLRSTSKLFGESILALFLSGSLALAAVLLSSGKGLGVGLLSVLFGSITTVSPSDVLLIAVLGLIVAVLVIVFFKELMMVTFDEEIARAEGIAVKFFNFLIIILAAVVVAVSMRIVGVLLIGAMMVIPVLTALQFGVGFKKTLLWAEVFSLIATVGGLFLSYVLDWASGGTIVLLALALFILAVGVRKIKQ